MRRYDLENRRSCSHQIDSRSSSEPAGDVDETDALLAVSKHTFVIKNEATDFILLQINPLTQVRAVLTGLSRSWAVMHRFHKREFAPTRLEIEIHRVE